MGQFRDAFDKQFPPKTDQERAVYYASRRVRESQAPFWHSLVIYPLSFACAALCFAPVLAFFWWMS